MNIALLGPSGAGKGTHADMLAARCGLRHVATGDLFRENVRRRSALGRLAQKYMSQGELVPDEVVDAMIEEWGDTLGPDDGTLFDGFPRTFDQVHFLAALLQRLQRELSAVIYLHVPDAEIVQRLSGRLICQVCQTPYHAHFNPPQTPGVCDRCGGPTSARPDDIPELVRSRLRVFHRTSEPVLAHYANAGKLVIVPGDGPIESVRAALIDAFAAIADRSIRFAEVEEIARLLPAPAVTAVPPMMVRPTLDLVLLGGPGSGKGTQAHHLSAALQVPHIASGDLFRENLQRATPLGQLARRYMDRGELVPDDVTDAMIEERLARADTLEGFILDGFPRTRRQAEALHDMLTLQRRRLAAVFYIDVPDAVLIERLAGRLICLGCGAPFHREFRPPRQAGICDHCGGALHTRSDDTADTVRARLITFHRQTEPLIAYFRDAGILTQVPGAAEADAITAHCLERLREVASRAGIARATGPFQTSAAASTPHLV